MDALSFTDEQFYRRLHTHVLKIYDNTDSKDITNNLLAIFESAFPKISQNNHEIYNLNWSEHDVLLITYGNSIHSGSEKPLHVLYKFLMKYMKGVVNSVHILPFFPFSSDDGFAVIDYKKVNKELGDWNNIKGIADQFKLMADLVINHISTKSEWFKQYINGEEPGCHYFKEASSQDDISQVVRPRSSPLLQRIETSRGEKHVWCTFGFDQVDLNFSNPQVLIEIVAILKFYLDKGVQIVRLDAIAFLWKQIGTTCINLPQTHEVVKVLRLLCERFYPNVVFVTETNVPNLENIKYFGNSNEAHIIYNFSLPPLLLHSLWRGNSDYLTKWSMSLPPAPLGCAYLNFTASHDGIGLRPAEGILSDDEIDLLVSDIQQFGGEVTTRAISKTSERPYEINTTWMEAMKGTAKGLDNYQIERFLCSQIVMLGLEGIPAFYINSLFAAENDYEKFKLTKHKRSINRKHWEFAELQSLLFDDKSKSSKIFYELKRLISIRSKQAAFHPNATQYTLHLGPNIFGFWRQSINRDQSIFAIHNLTSSQQELFLSNVNLICTDNWIDLIAWDILDNSKDKILLQPYQCLWITNKS